MVPMVHVLGDSQAPGTFGGASGVNAMCIGSITMRRAGWAEDPTLVRGLAAGMLAPGDVVLLCFGEIDVRFKMKARMSRRQACTVVHELVCGYLDRVAQLDARGAQLGIVSIIPPNRRRTANTTVIPEGVTDEERSEYTAVLNAALRLGCQERGLLFVDVYSEYVDGDGLLPEELSELHGSHVGDRTKAHALLARMRLLS